MTDKLYVRDDNGILWTFDGYRVFVVGTEDVPGSGYSAEDWAEAIKKLNEYDYITGPKESE